MSRKRLHVDIVIYYLNDSAARPQGLVFAPFLSLRSAVKLVDLENDTLKKYNAALGAAAAGYALILITFCIIKKLIGQCCTKQLSLVPDPFLE